MLIRNIFVILQIPANLFLHLYVITPDKNPLSKKYSKVYKSSFVNKYQINKP
jgi:hypothetical protein